MRFQGIFSSDSPRCNIFILLLLHVTCNRLELCLCNALLLLPSWDHHPVQPPMYDSSITRILHVGNNNPTVATWSTKPNQAKLVPTLLSWLQVSSSLTVSMPYVSSSSIIFAENDIDSDDFVQMPNDMKKQETQQAPRGTDSSNYIKTSEEQLAWLKSMRVVQTDEVVRVVDGNTVQLANNGFVTLAAVQSPSFYNNNNNECISVYPSSKLKQLLPPRRKVQFVKLIEENNKKRSLVFTKTISKTNKEENTIFVNAELIKTGMGKPTTRGQAQADKLLPGIIQYFDYLHDQAKTQKLGMYQPCDIESPSSSSSTTMTTTKKEYDFDNQFEPMELSIETQWGDDGGKQILKNNKKDENKPLPNPGDSKQCYDFNTYEEALQWYERYYPLYGDVAQLDKDGDGIPCSGLPHTTNPERYRIKKKVISNN